MSWRDLVLTPTGLRFAGRVFPCSLGRSGVIRREAKREGDNATPSGLHHIIGCLYRPDRIARPVAWADAIGPMDLWSDDPRDPEYNHLVRAPHRFSHEALRRADPMYDLVLTTDWNWPDARERRGSAIFLHRWRRPGAPTAGCVAMSAENLLWISRRIGPGTRLIVPEALARG
ncbi:L,D-transpeptidase family protein [Frigidibacter sp. ROC022]|uniref:L,D-transpeptidase family protein n=1 Tax=Frigidibacter sp. ROC022 TaxID=2971796 RepID=UPI00215AF326|nr:L,D-transpeptidase family protein [Frigidibacter sp. ROC022]MCR8724949.1 L,D-transpeptidase family protein [Frigidibacter sp. ROC022]